MNILVFILSLVVVGLIVWFGVSRYYQEKLNSLKIENANLKMSAQLNENIINEVKVAFSKIAQESLKDQQEQLLSVHSTDLKNKIELLKAQEINRINTLLKAFKEIIDNYQKSHQTDSLEIQNAISTAEKYARALTTNQNLKGEFGEDWLEQILKFVNLQENVHYVKQYSSQGGSLQGVKPDFVVNLPDDKHLIIDSKVILKHFIDYTQTQDEGIKKTFIPDLSNCVNSLAKKDYEGVEELNQPGFILMYIPIETCVNLIYTDYDFKSVVELANSKNIIIVGTASVIVTLRLINQLWATKTQYDSVKNIIEVGSNLYNNIAQHSQNLLKIRDNVENTLKVVDTEINRFTKRNNGSIFKEAEKLKEFGIEAKVGKTGKKIVENSIAKEFLGVNSADNTEEIM